MSGVAYILVNECNMRVTALRKKAVVSLSGGVSVQRGTSGDTSEGPYTSIDARCHFYLRGLEKSKWTHTHPIW